MGGRDSQLVDATGSSTHHVNEDAVRKRKRVVAESTKEKKKTNGAKRKPEVVQEKAKVKGKVIVQPNQLSSEETKTANSIKVVGDYNELFDKLTGVVCSKTKTPRLFVPPKDVTAFTAFSKSQLEEGIEQNLFSDLQLPVIEQILSTSTPPFVTVDPSQPHTITSTSTAQSELATQTDVMDPFFGNLNDNERSRLFDVITKVVRLRDVDAGVADIVDKINRADRTGQTKLHLSVMSTNDGSGNHLDEVVSLLNQGADVMALDNAGLSALHKAEDARLSKILLDAGADPSFALHDNNTPVHEAALYGNDDVLRVLLRSGGSVDSVNKDGKTPFDLASSENTRLILKKYMDNPADTGPRLTFPDFSPPPAFNVLGLDSWKFSCPLCSKKFKSKKSQHDHTLRANCVNSLKRL